MKGLNFIKLTVHQKGSAENLNFSKIPIWGKCRKFEAQLPTRTVVVWFDHRA